MSCNGLNSIELETNLLIFLHQNPWKRYAHTFDYTTKRTGMWEVLKQNKEFFK